jgi:hypothetical protein
VDTAATLPVADRHVMMTRTFRNLATARRNLRPLTHYADIVADQIGVWLSIEPDVVSPPVMVVGNSVSDYFNNL